MNGTNEKKGTNGTSHTLSSAEKRVLMHIESYENVTSSDISDGTGLSKAAVNKALVNLVAGGFATIGRTMVRRGRGSGRAARTYAITTEGCDLLHPPRAPEERDWSTTPSLTYGEGDTVAVSQTHVPEPVPETVPVPEDAPESVPESVSEPVPEAVPEDTPRPDAAVDIEALRRASESLRAIATDVPDIDFDAVALAERVDARIRESVAPCPCCGGAMTVMKKATALMCRDCRLTVALSREGAGLNDLIAVFNRRA